HLAGYRIEGVAGRGGMGVVYLAEHIHLGRRVALKTLSGPRGADEEFRERFIRESRMAARIDHPHIVPIFDAGEADGLLYLAMRLVTGGDLQGMIDDHAPLAVDMTLGMMRQVASALDAAHAQGLVHRDVKPGNVLLERAPAEHAPHCFLADFGLTKHSSSDTALTSAGQLLGTLSYVAPEQIEGAALDGRADQYSLACMLHECLTGAPPFRTDSDSALPLIAAHLHDSPPPLSAARPDLPGALDEALQRALAKSPAQRYPDCTALVDALEDAAGAPHTTPAAAVPRELEDTIDFTRVDEGEPPTASDPAPPPAGATPDPAEEQTYTVDRPQPAASPRRPAPPPPGGRPTPPPARRGRLVAAVAGVLAVLAIGGITAAQVLTGAETSAEDPPPDPDPDDPDPDDPDSDDPDPREPTDPPETTDPTDPTAVAEPIAFVAERDGNREIYIVGADGVDPQNLTEHPADDRQPAWSPDRQEIAFASNRGDRFALYAIQVADGSVRQLTEGGTQDGDFDPAWSPDGEAVVFSRQLEGRRDLYVVDADGTGARPLTGGEGSDARPAWSPDGTQIAFQSDRDGRLDIWVMDADGTGLRNVTDHPSSDFHPSWSAQGDRIVFASERSGAANVMVISPDGSDLSALTDSDARDDLDPAFSPDGRFVAFESDRDGQKEIYVVGADGGSAVRVTDHSADDRDPGW
ncbi:MAG: protein kinase, partial [Egibacteraceae bacterium]